MKWILVPTDFSACANNAVDFAVQSAKILPVEVMLVHSFEVTGNTYSDYMGVNREFNQTLLHEANHEFARVKSVIKETENISVESFVSTTSLNESILSLTDEKGFDFIVMGTSGASGLKEKLWGSKTADVIGKCHVPVMAIPVDYKWKKPAKILLSTNHFEKEPALLDFLFELAALYKAEVHVAVYTDEEADIAVSFLEHARKIPAYEKELRKQYKDESIVVTHLYGKDFESALQDHIVQHEIDILTMVTYQRKFPDNLFHPSLTKKMAYHTKIPLLAIPANKVG
jgi:nucleotide-binding universal stress UspA family protein